MSSSHRSPPVTSRWARFGPPDRRWFAHVPRHGVCLSVFVVVRNPAGEVLLGVPAVHRDWPERGCLPTWRVRPLARERRWILPASHLLVGEAPDAAARRVAAFWAGLPGSRPRLIAIANERMPVARRRRAGAPVPFHWALGFVYELVTDRVPRRRRAWAELRFVPERERPRLRWGREHQDLLRRYDAARVRSP